MRDGAGWGGLGRGAVASSHAARMELRSVAPTRRIDSWRGTRSAPGRGSGHSHSPTPQPTPPPPPPRPPPPRPTAGPCPARPLSSHPRPARSHPNPPLPTAGVFLPIIRSVAAVEGPQRQAGAYLAQSQLQASSHTCALFLTASAQNVLCLQLAEGLGVDVGSHFVTWTAGACVPALIGARRAQHAPPGKHHARTGARVRRKLMRERCASARVAAAGSGRAEWCVVRRDVSGVTGVCVHCFGRSAGTRSPQAPLLHPTWWPGCSRPRRAAHRQRQRRPPRGWRRWGR